jgi:hypothetical protein
MIHVGFDSAPIKKGLLLPDGTKGKEFVANLGVSVTTLDKDKFELSYESAISEIFKKFGLDRKKKIYKGAHLVGQTLENAPAIIAAVLDKLEAEIAHVDVYCAYYAREYVSIYGQSETQKLSPPAFVKKTQGAFPHVCAWWYALSYAKTESPLCLEIDYMQTATTPAWRNLLGIANKNTRLEFYFGGDECNPLISVADLILKLIRVYHRGSVEGRSLLSPLHEKCEAFRSKRKTWFHNLGSRGFILKATAPDLPLQADVKPFVKHPIFFYSWSSSSGKKKDEIVKALAWSPVYNAIAYHTAMEKGGMKSFSPAEDPLLWKPSEDRIVPLAKEDEDRIKKLGTLGYEVPKIISPKDLVRTAKY